jgi:hypothetical protein
MGPKIKGQHLGPHGLRKVLSPSLYPQHHGHWLEQDKEVRINMIRSNDQKSSCTGRDWAIRDTVVGNLYEGYAVDHFPKLNYLLSKHSGYRQSSSSEGKLYCTSSTYVL